MKRPKSAVIMSMPYNFSSKEDAIAAKRKAIDLFNESTDDFLATTKRSTIETLRSTVQSYCDTGPSLFYTVGQKYKEKKKKTEKKLIPLQKIRGKSVELSINLSISQSERK